MSSETNQPFRILLILTCVLAHVLGGKRLARASHDDAIGILL